MQYVITYSVQRWCFAHVHYVHIYRECRRRLGTNLAFMRVSSHIYLKHHSQGYISYMRMRMNIRWGVYERTSVSVMQLISLHYYYSVINENYSQGCSRGRPGGTPLGALGALELKNI